MFKADKVHGVLIHPSDDVVIVKAAVEASFSLARTYSTHVELHTDGSVKGGSCNCKAGCGGVCKHVAALLWFMLDVLRTEHLFLPESTSCTGRPRGWGPRNGVRRKTTTESFSDLSFEKHAPGKAARPAKKPVVKAERVVVKSSSLRRMTESLQECGVSSMMCATIREGGYEAGPRRSLPCINDGPQLSTNEGVPLAGHVRLPLSVLWGSPENITDDCNLTLDEAHELEQKTRGQADKTLWYEERAKRVTASRFGDVVKRQAPITEKFRASIFSSGQTTSSKYMKMGKDNEPHALARYKQARGVTIYPVGLCVNPGISVLGASPDGLVWDPDVEQWGLVEVKTLAKAMEEGLTVKEAISKDMVPYLKDGVLKSNHKNNLQIQGQLAITGLKWCDLVVDSGCQDPMVQRVPFDELLWKDMLPKLLSFHAAYYKGTENVCV
ncbi:unnamed protein product [Ixodes hexagonus]